MSSTSLKSTNSYEELYDLEFAVPFDLKSIHLVNQEQMSINLRDLISGFQSLLATFFFLSELTLDS